MNDDSIPPIGLRVREIRRRKHISQADLARRVGIRSGPMNQIEKGLHIPSGRVLLKLASVLEVSLDELCAVAPATGYVCGDSEAPAVARDSALALPPLDTPDPGEPGRLMLDCVTRGILALEDLCGAQKYAGIPLNLPFYADEANAEQLANQVRKLLGIGDAVVFDYIELFENAGLRICFADIPAGAASLACIDRPNGNVVILVGNAFTAERKQFRILFELGRTYWQMQALQQSGAGLKPRDAAMGEKHFACKFAAFFLMPASAVRSSVKQLGVQPGDWTLELALRMKHRFGVSAESFVIRLEELGLVTARVAGRLKDAIRADYKRTGFQEPDESRRILSENGRLGDLLTAAGSRRTAAAEVARIATEFEGFGMHWGNHPAQGRV